MSTLAAPVRGRTAVHPTGVERSFGADELIVSKTDRRGVITYANDVFLRVGAYSLDEVIGQPHNLIRHPEMPRAVFHLLWDTISRGQELFAYINNLAAAPPPARWPGSVRSTPHCWPRNGSTAARRPRSPPPRGSWTGWWPSRPPATRT